MTQAHHISRRTALQLGAAAAALPLAHIRTTGAAGTLKIALGSHLTPGADTALQKLIEQWATQANTQVQIDFLSGANRQLFLVAAAEAQARSGHDVMHMGYSDPVTYAELLEPVDDVVGRLERKYGSVNETAVHTGKVDGRWAAVPTCILSQVYPCVGRLDIFRQHVGMDLREIFPAKPEMGPGYDQWTWEAFLRGAERCAKAGVPFGLPISACGDAQLWLGMLLRSYGAELIDAEGNVTVNSDAVRGVLEYLKRLSPYLGSDVYSWDNTSNNRALAAGRSALIVNPTSAWAGAVKDQPQVGSQCWHFPPPTGPRGRFTGYFPFFLGVWSFSPNKGAAKELIEWLSQREQTERICTADRGDDIPPFLSMSDFRVWEEEGPPKGTLANYPIKPGHHASPTLPTYPAPLDIVAPLNSRFILPNLVAKVTHGGQSVEQAISWAQGELESLRR